MKEIKITFSLPILVGDTFSPSYLQGYADATIAPIRAEIESGTLNIDRMLDAGWDINIPDSYEQLAQVYAGGIGGPLNPIAITEDSLMS